MSARSLWVAWTLLALSLAGGLALSACGSRTPETAPPPTGPAPAAAPSAAPATVPAATARFVAAPATTAPAMATLTVKVTDLRNHNGQLIFGVFKSADGFPTDPAKSVNWQIKDADADAVTFRASLPPGRYGASVLHDENRNNQMDRNLAGIPKEGYGVTNNPKPALRAATFGEATFTLPPQGATMTISLQYF